MRLNHKRYLLGKLDARNRLWLQHEEYDAIDCRGEPCKITAHLKKTPLSGPSRMSLEGLLLRYFSSGDAHEKYARECAAAISGRHPDDHHRDWSVVICDWELAAGRTQDDVYRLIAGLPSRWPRRTDPD